MVYSLDGHASGIKEKIQVRIGHKLDWYEKGIDKSIKFLDGIYLKDEMSEAWNKYKSFQKVKRGKNQVLMAFIADLDGWMDVYFHIHTHGTGGTLWGAEYIRLLEENVV